MTTNKLIFILAAIIFALASLGVSIDRFQTIPLVLFLVALGLFLVFLGLTV